MKVYEAAVVLKDDLQEEQIEDLFTQLLNLIKDSDGEMLDVDNWGKRKLAYEINNYFAGYYTILSFRAPANIISEVDRILKIKDEVLRHLIVRKEQ